MNLIKKKKKSFNYFEYFILRILKNGQKYKYLKFLKNIFILFSKYCYINRFRVPTGNYLSNSILNKRSLEFNSHNYTFVIKRVYKKKKWKKHINVTRLNFNHSREKELYKLLYYILHKLNIRTLQLRLFYLTYVFNFRFFRRIKLYKKLKKYYYRQLRNQRRKFSFVFKKNLFYGQPTFCFKKLNKINYNWVTKLYTNFKNNLRSKFIDKLNTNLLFQYYFYLNFLKKNCGNIYLKKRLKKKKIKVKITKLAMKKRNITHTRFFNFYTKSLKKKYLQFSNFTYNRRNFFYEQYYKPLKIKCIKYVIIFYYNNNFIFFPIFLWYTTNF